MQKKWQLKPKIDRDFIDKFPEVNNIILQLLYNRGLKTEKEIDAFLFPNYDTEVLDPFLFKDMESAVKRVISAIYKNEKILIYGDYDADGICSTAILFNVLKSLGVDVETYIPFREIEGYGLNKKIVQVFIKQKHDLIITVDCGVSNSEEIALLKEQGIDTVILDHHKEPLKRPDAVAIINPSLDDSGYPFRQLCGAGVVYKFIQALNIRLEEENSPIKLPPGYEKWLLDLVAIASIADIVNLTGENRIFVKYGLIVLEKTINSGLKKLVESINYKSGIIDTTFVGWRIVPRLNAAGRIEHASLALNLLLEKEEKKAEKMVEFLEVNNKKRQQITENILNAALSQIKDVSDQQKLLCIVGEKWPAGVVGLVAGRISDKYNRPTLVISREGGEKLQDAKFVGSGRSVQGFDITDALKKCEKFLTRFGGHSQACGFSIVGENNFLKFKKEMEKISLEKLAENDLTPVMEIDTEINITDIDWRLWEDLDKFEPFGEGNEKPIFASFGLRVEQIQAVGIDGKHLRLKVSQREKMQKLIGFSFGEWCSKLKNGDIIDIVFELDINEWNGNRELQLKLVDLKLSEGLSD